MKEVKGFLAGVFISIGGIAYLNNLGTWYAPFLFSIGLVAVISMGTPLYTGRIGYAKFTVSDGINYLKMLLCNLYGAFCIGSLYSLYKDIDVSTLIANKLAETPLECFILSIGCGMMMYIAVEGYKRLHNFMIVIFAVAVFIICGFEHCIANMFYFSYEGSFNTETGIRLLIAVLGNTVGAIGLNWVLQDKDV